MYTTTVQSHPIAGSASISGHSKSLVARFINWSESQQDARFVWLGVALLAHASFFTPFTLMAIMLTTGSFALIMASLAAMGLALITNLAALPTKVTIPAFFLSVAVDIVIVALTLFVL